MKNKSLFLIFIKERKYKSATSVLYQNVNAEKNPNEEIKLKHR